MKQLWPDVIVLDIEMPRMDGLSFLRKIMAEHPTPVVICSSLAEQGAKATMEALSAGAVTIITKPKVGLKSFLEDSANDIANAVKGAARANLRALTHQSPLPVAPKLTADAILAPGNAMSVTTGQVVAIAPPHRRHTGFGSGTDASAGQHWISRNAGICRQSLPHCTQESG